MASQITGVSVVYSAVCSSADQQKHQSSASLAFVRGIHRWPVNSPHKGPVTRKMFPFDDVTMRLLCAVLHIVVTITGFNYLSSHLSSYLSSYSILINGSPNENEINKHLHSNERADWPKLHDMFKARDAKTWQRGFPVGFPVIVCASNLLLVTIFRDVVARIESRYMIKAKHALLVCLFVRFFTGKTALALKRSCNFSREETNKLTDQQDIFYYIALWVCAI